MTNHALLLEQFNELMTIKKRGDIDRLVRMMYDFEEALNNSRGSLNSSELSKLDRDFSLLVEGVIEQYFSFKEQIIQQQRERGETPPNETQVGGCVENNNHYKNRYPGFRSIRGDGNCYYRAVMVGLIEQIIQSPRREELFLDLSRKFERLFESYEGQYDDKIISFVFALKAASRGECWKTVEDFSNELRQPDSQLDAQMIQSARCLNANTAKKWVMDGFQSLIDEDTLKILKMGEEAEGLSIQTLPKELGIAFDLVWPEVNRVDHYPPDATNSFGDAPEQFKVALLYSTNPGHYDLLYAPEQYHQLQLHQVFEPIKEKAISASQLIEDYTNYFYNYSPKLDNAKKDLFEYIRGCPPQESELIEKQLKECFSNLEMIGRAEGMQESFFIRLQQNKEEFDRFFAQITHIAPTLHRSSIFRPANVDYRTFLRLILSNPLAHEQHFNNLLEHLKTLSPEAIEFAMEKIHNEINLLKNKDNQTYKILNSALIAFDFQVQKMFNPDKLEEFKANLKRYVTELGKDPRAAREALLETIIMFPRYVQSSLYREVNTIFTSLGRKNPQMKDLINQEFSFLRDFISNRDSIKLRK